MPIDESLDKNDTTKAKGEDVFFDIKYICNSTSLITDSLQKGCDIAQLHNGDIIVTECKIVHTHYRWDKFKLKMVKINQT